MLERFTERARQVLVLAKDEATTMHHGLLGTEHILLGLLREEEGLAARVLASFDLTTNRIRPAVLKIVPEGISSYSTPTPYTPRAKKALELALREALSLGHNYIGTEHILLGLIRENEGVAMRILADFGLDAEKIRNETIRLLSGARADERPRNTWGTNEGTSRSDTDLLLEELKQFATKAKRSIEAALEAW